MGINNNNTNFTKNTKNQIIICKNINKIDLQQKLDFGLNYYHLAIKKCSESNNLNDDHNNFIICENPNNIKNSEKSENSNNYVKKSNNSFIKKIAIFGMASILLFVVFSSKNGLNESCEIDGVGVDK